MDNNDVTGARYHHLGQERIYHLQGSEDQHRHAYHADFGAR
ncbi:MAG: hypothetical protein R2795_16385 [Saprospiraceae bacterium]